MCRVLGQSRSTQRYSSSRPLKDRELLAEMRRLARQRPRFGCERIFELLVGRAMKQGDVIQLQLGKSNKEISQIVT